MQAFLRRRGMLRRPVVDRAESGQVVVIFAGAAFVLILLMAIVIDISWLWANTLRIQRAADAAALAGAVTLPNDEPRGITLANREATKNGYTSGTTSVGITTVTPRQDTNNPNRMVVSITAPVPTFFARMVGIRTWNVTRVSRAEYNLPLKMGSPQNYYGVGQFNVPTTTTTNDNDSGDTDYNETDDDNGSNQPSQVWSNPQRAIDNDGNYTSETAPNDTQSWDEFDLQDGDDSQGIPEAGTFTSGGTQTVRTVQVTGVFVRLNDVRLTGGSSGTANTNCQVGVEIWRDSANAWTPQIRVPITSTSDTNPDPVVPTLPADVALWAPLTWTYDDFSNSNFIVRLQWIEGTGCGNGSINRGIELDALEARVTWTSQETRTTTNPPSAQNVIAPDGTVLAPQNFWGAMQSYGAPARQGDAHMTGFEDRTSNLNEEYDPTAFYNYAVEIPAGASGGEVWIFDPAFCDTSPSSNDRGQGTGETWSVGGDNGADTRRHVNAIYELWNMQQTPYDREDDVLVATSGTTFTGSTMNQSDPFLGGDSQASRSCENYAYHANASAETRTTWWQVPAPPLGPGLYRLHTASRLPTDPTSDQQNATGLNAFAIWSRTATGPAPKVYGLGAMEAYFALPENQISTFYLAQIERQYAGKWLDIDLWDPGDTGDLDAVLRILIPTGSGSCNGVSGYACATFYQNENPEDETSIPANFSCGPSTSSARTSITTSTGGGAIYNGQWLRLCVQVPTNYTAPRPSGEPAGGWWKIQYDMGTGDSPSTDLTTWKVTVRDNPVHLVVD